MVIPVLGLNSVEKLCDELMRRVNKYLEKFVERFFIKEWSDIPHHVLYSLIKHYRRRNRAIIIAKY